MGLRTLIAALFLIRHWAVNASPLPRAFPAPFEVLPLAPFGGDNEIDIDIPTSIGTIPASPITITTTSTTILVTVTPTPTTSTSLASTTLASPLKTTVDPFHGPGFHKFNHTRISHFSDATATSLLSTLPFATAVATLIPVHPAGFHHINESYAPHYDNVAASGVSVSEDVTALLTARAEGAVETWAAGGVGPVVSEPAMPVDLPKVNVPTLIGNVAVSEAEMPAKGWVAWGTGP